MKSAAEVDALIKKYKEERMPLSEAVFQTGVDCVGYPYTFGAEGRKVTKDGIVVRTFDCQGFTEWCLGQYGIDIRAAGCTSQWNNDAFWRAKGDISSIPDDILVCLFHRSKDDPKKMAHTGFGFRGQTVECQKGVQYFKQRKSKWQYWAVPKGIDGDIPVPTTKPTLRRGDKGVYVTLAQTELINKGYNLGKWGADGSFGAATEEAVKSFQKDNGLVIDGIIGQKTWAALDDTSVKLYTVTVPHLTETVADKLCKEYPGAVKSEEVG